MTAQDTPAASTLDAAQVTALIKRLRGRADEQERNNSYPIDRAWDREAADALAALQQQLDEARAEIGRLTLVSSALAKGPINNPPTTGRKPSTLADFPEAELALSARDAKETNECETVPVQKSGQETAEHGSGTIDRSLSGGVAAALSARDAPQAQAVYQVKLIDGNWRDLNKSEVPEANDWGELVRVLYARPSTPEAKPVEALVETSIDTMREAANDELRRNGWHKQPNARLALHQVKELMAAFGMHVYRGEVGCNWPNCGCCADAACADALPAIATLDNHKDQRK